MDVSPQVKQTTLYPTFTHLGRKARLTARLKNTQRDQKAGNTVQIFQITNSSYHANTGQQELTTQMETYLYFRESALAGPGEWWTGAVLTTHHSFCMSRR